MKRPLQRIKIEIHKCSNFIYYGTNLNVHSYNFKYHSTVDNRYVCRILEDALEYSEYSNI